MERSTYSLRPRSGALLLVALLCAARLAFPQAAVDDVDRPIKTAARNPDAVAVVIGIAKYQHPDVPEVEFAVNDAQAIKRVLIDTLGYREDRVLLRTNEDASVGRLKSLMRQELPARVIAGKSDVFVYYSGHGAPNADTREASLIPWDYDPRYALTSDSAYPLKEFYSDLGKLKARSVIVTLDACFSGRSESGMVLKDVSPPYIEVPLPELPSGVVITATGPREVATWDREHRHGLLTYYLLRALRGEAADEKGRVTAAQLERYLKDKVPQAARELRQRNQTPQVTALDPGRFLAQLPISALKTGEAKVIQRFGSLDITIDVGGELLIDGVSQGVIPAGQAFVHEKVAAGPHQLEVRKEGYRPVSEQVIVLPDQPLRKTYQLAAILAEKPELVKAYGLIQVTADAGGTLYIDGQTVAELKPFARFTSARVEAGPHQVRVEKAGYQATEQQVLVLPNQTAAAELKLVWSAGVSPAPGPGSAKKAPGAGGTPALQTDAGGLAYVWVPPGTFMMGCSPGDSECDSVEKPAHRVTITRGFWMGQTEVTVGAYQRFVSTAGRRMPKGRSFRGAQMHPVVNVSWDDAAAYCGWAGGRLPTEAEWEYAARAGSAEARYGLIDDIAWHSSNSGGRAHDVGQKRANALGLYDMLGNAYERVADWYADANYVSSPASDPTGPSSGESRVLRGGSWKGKAGDIRVSKRGTISFFAGYKFGEVGFRCVRELIP